MIRIAGIIHCSCEAPPPKAWLLLVLEQNLWFFTESWGMMSARECRGKVLRELFQKLTVSRGRASCGTAQSAKSLKLAIARRGEKQSGGLFFVGYPRRAAPGAKHKMIKVSNMIPQISVKRETYYFYIISFIRDFCRGKCVRITRTCDRSETLSH